MSEFYLKRGKTQKVTDEQILEAFEKNRFNSLSEAARFIAANYASDGSFTHAALRKRLKALGYQVVNGKLEEFHEFNLENALAGAILTSLNKLTEKDKELALEYAHAVLQILLTGKEYDGNNIIIAAAMIIGKDGKFLFQLHDRLKVNADE